MTNVGNGPLYIPPEFEHKLFDDVLEMPQNFQWLRESKNDIRIVRFENKPSKVESSRGSNHQKTLHNDKDFTVNDQFSTNLFPKMKKGVFQIITEDPLNPALSTTISVGSISVTLIVPIGGGLQKM